MYVLKIWEDNRLKNKLLCFFLSLLLSLTLTSCGEDPALAQFKIDIDSFCTNISQLDTSINNIDATSGNAIQELLTYLDELDAEFQKLAVIDFPEEFNYLEDLAVESSEYMTQAVTSYHEAYSNNSYNEYIAEYAHENYSRAYKRVQIIITFLHGEEPNDSDLIIE